MVITPVQAFRVLDPLRQQMEQLFDDMLQRDAGNGLPLWARGFTLLSSNRNPTWTPAIKIQETEAEIILQAEVPVVDAEALDIEVSHEAVSIVGSGCEKYTPKFTHGQFQRIVRLPALIQNDQVKFKFKDGILTLTMPKLESDQKKQVAALTR